MKNILRNRDGELLKVILLGVALAMSLVMFSKVYFENSYEDFVPKAERIYRVHPRFTRAGLRMIPQWATTPGGIAPTIIKFSPLFESATRYKVYRNDAAFYKVSDSDSDDARSVVCSEMILADSNFLSFFPRNVIGATMEDIASTSHDVLLSRSLAESLSHDGDAESIIGSMIRSNAIVIDEDFTVKGIFDDFPKNSSLCDIEVIGSVELNNLFYDEEDHNRLMGNEVYHSYVRLQPNVEVAELDKAIENAIETDIVKTYKDFIPDDMSIGYYLEGIKTIHTSEQSVRSTITLLLILGISVLAIAMLNYVLFAVTALVKRAKNIATRRCYGAPTWVIYKMLISDALSTLLLSLALAVFLLFALKPNIEAITGVRYVDLFTFDIVWIVVVVSLMVVMVCGVVPAAIYSKIPLSAAFQRFKERNTKWKYALLAVQFSGAMLFIALLSIMTLQYRYLLSVDIGYKYDNLLYVQFERFNSDGYKEVKDNVIKVAGVEKVARCSDLPYTFLSSNSTYDSQDGFLFSSNEMSAADEDLPSIFGLEIVEGRDFDAEHPTGQEALVSKSFVEQMSKYKDWSDGAVGKSFQMSSHNHNDEYSTVCGVYEDFLVGNAVTLDDMPSVIFYSETQSHNYNVKMKYLVIKVREDTQEIRTAIQNAIKEIVPSQNTEIRNYSAEFEQSYSDSKNFRNMVLYAGLIVLIITLIGLVGYTRDEISRRRSEIAIRKIHGATTSEIIQIFMRDVVWLLLFGLLAGGAASLYAANSLLEMFAYKITLSPWIFLLSAVVVTAVIAAVVISTTHRAADANPVDNLN
ncbi:MAG: ABC transporter permease [Rikenellaceae bacterium]